MTERLVSELRGWAGPNAEIMSDHARLTNLIHLANRAADEIERLRVELKGFRGTFVVLRDRIDLILE